MGLAPIALFIYNRPEHTRLALESLLSCPEFVHSPVHVFCDAPKRSRDQEKVRLARKVVHDFGLSNALIVERELNLGLAQSIITGVTLLCQRYGRVIVMEDDLVVSPYFLDYMNRALEFYADEERVMQISGYMFPVRTDANTDAVFLPFATSWGWATWARAWKHFDRDLTGYAPLQADKVLRKRFNLDGSYPYFSILKKQMRGTISSWAICWNLTVFSKQGVVLYPTKSYVMNIGFDGSGTHCRAIGRHHDVIVPTNVTRSLPMVSVDNDCYDIVKKYLRYHNSVYSRCVGKMANLFHRSIRE